MQAFALVELGISFSDFGKIWLAQFNALSEAVLERDKKAHYCAAMVCATLAEIHRNTKTRSAPFNAMEFLPKYNGDGDPESVVIGDLVSAVAELNKAFGGVDKRKKKDKKHA